MLARQVWPSRPAFSTPFTEFDQLRRDMLHLLATEPAKSGVFPPINITQDADNFYVRAEVPGIKADDLSISAVRNRVSIAGKREIPREHERVNYHRKERAEGSFNRTLTLPTDVNTTSIDARVVDGVLTLTLPKAEETKPRQIAVKT